MSNQNFPKRDFPQDRSYKINNLTNENTSKFGNKNIINYNNSISQNYNQNNLSNKQNSFQFPIQSDEYIKNKSFQIYQKNDFLRKQNLIEANHQSIMNPSSNQQIDLEHSVCDYVSENQKFQNNNINNFHNIDITRNNLNNYLNIQDNSQNSLYFSSNLNPQRSNNFESAGNLKDNDDVIILRQENNHNYLLRQNHGDYISQSHLSNAFISSHKNMTLENPEVISRNKNSRPDSKASENINSRDINNRYPKENNLIYNYDDNHIVDISVNRLIIQNPEIVKDNFPQYSIQNNFKNNSSNYAFPQQLSRDVADSSKLNNLDIYNMNNNKKYNFNYKLEEKNSLEINDLNKNRKISNIDYFSELTSKTIFIENNNINNNDHWKIINNIYNNEHNSSIEIQGVGEKNDLFSNPNDAFEINNENKEKSQENFEKNKNAINNNEERNKFLIKIGSESFGKRELDNSKIFNSDLISKSYSQDSNDYVVVKELIIDEGQLSLFYEKLVKENMQNFEIFYSNLENCYFSNKEEHLDKIGPISSLENYIEYKFADFLEQSKPIMEIELLENNIFRWRNICGEGNCFYRAVMFSYIENILIKNQDNLFLHLIKELYDFTMCAEPDPIFRMNSIDTKFLVNSLFYILYIFDKRSGKKNEFTKYELFIKLINNCRAVDLGLVSYLRLKIFTFLEENKNKIFSQDFNVKMGNLLSEKYEGDGENFNWQEFYKENLLRLYTEAENIIIYVTPLILKINLKIFTYEIGSNNSDKFRFISCGLENKDTIFVLYRKSHYDLIYAKEYFEKIQSSVLNYFDMNNSQVDIEVLKKLAKEQMLQQNSQQEACRQDRPDELEKAYDSQNKKISNKFEEPDENEFKLLKSKHINVEKANIDNSELNFNNQSNHPNSYSKNMNINNQPDIRISKLKEIYDNSHNKYHSEQINQLIGNKANAKPHPNEKNNKNINDSLYKIQAKGDEPLNDNKNNNTINKNNYNICELNKSSILYTSNVYATKLDTNIIPTFENDENKPQCHICRNLINPLISSFFNKKICKICFIKDLSSEIFTLKQNVISQSIENLLNSDRISFFDKIFLVKEDDSISIYNKLVQYKTIQKNFGIDLQEIINKFRMDNCLVCLVEESKECQPKDKIILPCNCTFYSVIHFKIFIDKMIINYNKSLNIKYNYSCLCGVNYSINDLLKLFDILRTYELEAKNVLKSLLLEKVFVWYCFNCQVNLFFHGEEPITNIKAKDNNFCLVTSTLFFYHTLCRGCSPKFRNFIDEHKLMLRRDDAQIEFPCSLCQIDHLLLYS